jgi:hypothetical protein
MERFFRRLSYVSGDLTRTSTPAAKKQNSTAEAILRADFWQLIAFS